MGQRYRFGIIRIQRLSKARGLDEKLWRECVERLRKSSGPNPEEGKPAKEKEKEWPKECGTGKAKTGMNQEGWKSKLLRKCQDEDRRWPTRLGLRMFKTMPTFMGLVKPETCLQAVEGRMGHKEQGTASTDDSQYVCNKRKNWNRGEARGGCGIRGRLFVLKRSDTLSHHTQR